MCSILYTTKLLTEQEICLANSLMCFRGPDKTSVLKNNGGTFIHNQLKITGDCLQPRVKKNIEVIFNGEIYNYVGIDEADFIIESYLKYGDNYAKYLDGEFAIILKDNNLKKILVTTDTFKTKPIYFSTDRGVHASTYKSALISLNLKNIMPCAPNTTIVFETPDSINHITNTVFNLNQYKTSYNDWIAAFKESIFKRSNTDKKIFIGLSSGYDSGCIAAELLNLNKNFHCFSILNNENIEVLEQRKLLLKNTEFIFYNKFNNSLLTVFLRKYCELQENTEYHFIKDSSTLPLLFIGKKGKMNNCKIFLSGTGCDEIMGDYFIKNIYELDGTSCFKGVFPDNLAQYFPWKNFYNGTMKEYITKDEYVMGCLGIEARYPFLDKKLVQEFLWLSPELKNKYYKSPLRFYLEQNNFPFAEEKRGFHV